MKPAPGKSLGATESARVPRPVADEVTRRAVHVPASSRRRLRRNHGLPAAGFLAALAYFVFGSFTANARPPNIVLIFADDLGWKDVGYQGSDFYETPNIDRLASEGMVFTDAYASAGNCAPSRACLHSGQYSPRHSVYAVGSTDRGPKELMRMIPVPNREDLPIENVTMAEALREAGYVTGLFGKWHLEGDPGTLPTDQGFDVYFDSRHPNPNKKRDEPDDPKGIYSLTRAAGDFMEEHRERPFFAMVSHHAIHSALEARPSSIEKFANKKPGAQHKHVLYAACTYDLDDGVGLVIAKIRELGLAGNTLVVFTSDNGATPQSSQEPLRGNKGGYYEGGIREPFIAWWPGVVPSGSTNGTPVTNVDLYPTFLAAAGAHPPVGKILDGASLMPAFKSEADTLDRAVFWHFPGYLDRPVLRGRDPVFRTRPVTVMRRGDWKLHLHHEEWLLDGGRGALPGSGAVELYNLADDIGERHDLAAAEPDRRDALLDEMLAWIEETPAPLPTERNPAYDPAARKAQESRPPPAR